MAAVLENIMLDPGTGFLFWRSGKKAGERAGGINSQGYRRIYLSGRYEQEHRVVWRMMHGEWPSLQIDHLNGNRSDNRPCNLRLADCSDQMKNRARPLNNTSGHHGVTFNKKSGKWQAQIGVGGKSVYLGLFSSIEMAAEARSKAELKYGFHDGHGRTKP